MISLYSFSVSHKFDLLEEKFVQNPGLSPNQEYRSPGIENCYGL